MKKYAKILSILLCLSMLVGMIAMVATAEEPATYKKVTSADELTTGQYILVADNGVSPGVLDGTWVTAVNANIKPSVLVIFLSAFTVELPGFF